MLKFEEPAFVRTPERSRGFAVKFGLRRVDRCEALQRSGVLTNAGSSNLSTTLATVVW